MGLLPKFFGNKQQKYIPAAQKVTTRELIQQEAKVGASLFGYLPPNRRREFFMLDRHTWIWYEEWKDARGQHRVTTRYELHKDYVLKIQNDRPAVPIDKEELKTLYDAIIAYYYTVADKVYNRPIPQN